MNKFNDKPGFLFDMDGLLINSEDISNRSFSEICFKYGDPFTDEIHASVQGTKSEFWSSYIVKECKLSITPDEFRQLHRENFAKLIDTELRILPGVKEILDWIDKKEYKRCLVTGSSLKSADKSLKLVNIDNKFPLRITSESYNKGKPDPEPYLQGSKLIQVSPKKCIVFEDSENGVISGKSAGCSVFAVPNQYSKGKPYKRADKVLGRISEAIYILEEWGL